MTMKVLSPLRLVFFVTLCGLLGLGWSHKTALGGIETAPAAEYIWTAPDYGTPVHHYVVEILVNDLDIVTMDPVPSEYVSVDVVYGNKYRVRVAAVDAAGRRGGYSPWSAPYTPELTPPQF